jgi:hypothetical protein
MKVIPKRMPSSIRTEEEEKKIEENQGNGTNECAKTRSLFTPQLFMVHMHGERVPVSKTHRFFATNVDCNTHVLALALEGNRGACIS